MARANKRNNKVPATKKAADTAVVDAVVDTAVETASVNVADTGKKSNKVPATKKAVAVAVAADAADAADAAESIFSGSEAIKAALDLVDEAFSTATDNADVSWDVLAHALDSLVAAKTKDDVVSAVFAVVSEAENLVTEHGAGTYQELDSLASAVAEAAKVIMENQSTLGVSDVSTADAEATKLLAAEEHKKDQERKQAAMRAERKIREATEDARLNGLKSLKEQEIAILAIIRNDQKRVVAIANALRDAIVTAHVLGSPMPWVRLTGLDTPTVTKLKKVVLKYSPLRQNKKKEWIVKDDLRNPDVNRSDFDLIADSAEAERMREEAVELLRDICNACREWNVKKKVIESDGNENETSESYHNRKTQAVVKKFESMVKTLNKDFNMRAEDVIELLTIELNLMKSNK